jgi:GNAT superfamily N-acetyltransferase
MTAAHDIAQQFLDALASNSAPALEAVLAEDAGLRLMRWDGAEAYRPRPKVIDRLQSEWSGWPDARLECLSTLADAERAALEFRIQATDPASGRYVEHIRSAFLTLANGRVQMIDLYCPEPFPSAHRQGWIAPATLTDDEINRVLQEAQFGFDARAQLPPKLEGRLSLRRSQDTSGLAHPGSNSVGGIRWTETEADAQIAALIETHRRRAIGFMWWVAPHDTPADLGQRLEAHGLVLAGSAAVMVRRGLDDLGAIPLNPDVTVEPADPTRDEHMDAVLQIGAASFGWTPEQLPEWRSNLLAMARNPYFHDKEFPYLAYLGGRPAGFARVSLRAGLAYLSGAATLPEARGHRVYSTLLRRRLEAAHARGYHLAAIQAEPMSRRIVARYGFVEYAQTSIYAWMPVIDMDVIRSLVPDD